MGNIKNFIDETIGSSSDIEMTLVTWYFQQFAMVSLFVAQSIIILIKVLFEFKKIKGVVLQ